VSFYNHDHQSCTHTAHSITASTTASTTAAVTNHWAAIQFASGKGKYCLNLRYKRFHLVISLPVGVHSIAMSASVWLWLCLFVGLSTRISKTRIQISPNFVYMLPVAVARSSSDDVLPVLRMTSCCHIWERMRRIRDDDCFVQFARWRHRGEVCRLRLHLVGICESPRPQEAHCITHCLASTVGEDFITFLLFHLYCSNFCSLSGTVTDQECETSCSHSWYLCGAITSCFQWQTWYWH